MCEIWSSLEGHSALLFLRGDILCAGRSGDLSKRGSASSASLESYGVFASPSPRPEASKAGLSRLYRAPLRRQDSLGRALAPPPDWPRAALHRPRQPTPAPCCYCDGYCCTRQRRVVAAETSERGSPTTADAYNPFHARTRGGVFLLCCCRCCSATTIPPQQQRQEQSISGRLASKTILLPLRAWLIAAFAFPIRSLASGRLPARN